MKKVIGLTEKINFGVVFLYNIVFVGSVEAIIKSKSLIETYRGKNVEMGFYAWDLSTQSIHEGNMRQ